MHDLEEDPIQHYHHPEQQQQQQDEVEDLEEELGEEGGNNNNLINYKKNNYSISSTVPSGSKTNCHNPHLYTTGTLHQRNVATVAAASVVDPLHHDYSDTYHDTIKAVSSGVWKQQQQQHGKSCQYNVTHQRKWPSFSSFFFFFQKLLLCIILEKTRDTE